MAFEVKFRGMNSYEAGQPVRADLGEMRAYAPTPEDPFECGASTARLLFEELRSAGAAGREVDGVVPHVVALDELHEFVLDGERLTVPYTRLWGYTDPDEPLYGTWAEVGHAG